MSIWEILVTKISTLLVTLGLIFTSYTLPTKEPSPLLPTPTIPRLTETPDVFPDFEPAEEVTIVLPRVEKPPVRKEPSSTTTPPTSPPPGPVLPPPETVPDVIIDATSLVDLQKKIEDLTRELRETLADKSSEPNLFTIADVNNKTRSALINVFCISKDASVRSVTGSGVLIDSRGVIITNSHVAQLLLLKDYPKNGSVDCTIRGGSPASPLYKAKILYMPISWVKENSTVLLESNPQGTGEDDYAFLYITDHLTGSRPTEFVHLPPLINDELKEGDTVVVAGYAAGFLSSLAIQNELFPVSAIAKITDLFTFKGGTMDLFSVAGTMVAQRGSSGGAAVDENGNLIGVIVTSTDGPNPADREMRAISLSHINRSLKENRGTTLSSLLSGNLEEKVTNFENLEAPRLKKILVDSIESR